MYHWFVPLCHYMLHLFLTGGNWEWCVQSIGASFPTASTVLWSISHLQHWSFLHVSCWHTFQFSPASCMVPRIPVGQGCNFWSKAAVCSPTTLERISQSQALMINQISTWIFDISASTLRMECNAKQPNYLCICLKENILWTGKASLFM